MPICSQHYFEHAPDKVFGDSLMEDIAHAVHEYKLGRLPRERVVQTFWPQPHRERVSSSYIRVYDWESRQIGIL